MPLPECLHIAKYLKDESDRGLISCIGKLLNPWIRNEELLAWQEEQLYNFILMSFLLSLKLLLTYCTVCYKLSMSIMLTIFDVSIKEKRVYDSLYFEFFPRQMSKSKKKNIDLCQLANRYKQAVFETLS